MHFGDDVTELKISRNAKCGKLQCQGGNTRPLTGTTRVAYRNTFSIGGVKYECKTVASLSSADVSDLGVARSGTMCDTGKVNLS